MIWVLSMLGCRMTIQSVLCSRHTARIESNMVCTLQTELGIKVIRIGTLIVISPKPCRATYVARRVLALRARALITSFGRAKLDICRARWGLGVVSETAYCICAQGA